MIFFPVFDIIMYYDAQDIRTENEDPICKDILKEDTKIKECKQQYKIKGNNSKIPLKY